MFKLGGFLISICEVKKSSRTDATDSTPTNDLTDDRLNKQIYDNLRATMYHGVLVSLIIKVVNAPRHSESTFLRNSNETGRKYAKIVMSKNENIFGWEFTLECDQHEDTDKILNSEISDKLDNDEFIKYSNDPLLVSREAITEMANDSLYEHADLHLRHVALLPVLSKDNSTHNETKLWKVKPILIDIHRVNKISPEQIEGVVTKSLEILLMELENSKQTMK